MEMSKRFGDVHKMKRNASSPVTTVAVVSDDLIREFLIRLPDLPSLASAALVSKRWRRVASDPATLRRFSLSRRPPLLGVIFSDRGDTSFPWRRPNLRFVPSHTGNPLLAAAAEAGDFLFEHLPHGDDGAGAARHRDDKWRLRGCDGGLLLLSRGKDSRDLAVYDPFAQTSVFFPPPPAALLIRKWWHVASLAIVADEADASFRVIAALFWHELEAAVFSSRTRDWAAVPTNGLVFDHRSRCEGGERAGRFAYWRSETKKVPNSIWDDAIYIGGGEEILVLDTATMEWSIIAAPFAVGESYCVADLAEHGGLCLVSSKEQLLQLWVRGNDDDEEWVVKKNVSLLKEFGFLKDIRRNEWMKRVRPLAVRGDYVLMEFWSIRKSHSYILLLNLKTMKVDIFRNDSTQPHRGPAFPFFMSSESPLLSLDRQTPNVQGA